MVIAGAGVEEHEGRAGAPPQSPRVRQGAKGQQNPRVRQRNAWLRRMAGLSAGSLVAGLIIGFRLPR
ncbi:hypothetical protein [Parafrankia elaeagni]|uniref:hypothetical protein n=1 Tax=Parafrankia elaeagni TaxID=222534 RepID=UPI00037CA0CE|nr:hypothetical protein [Parafrankia elaeagni]